jgi:hypothetical protein
LAYEIEMVAVGESEWQRPVAAIWQGELMTLNDAALVGHGSVFERKPLHAQNSINWIQ